MNVRNAAVVVWGETPKGMGSDHGIHTHTVLKTKHQAAGGQSNGEGSKADRESNRVHEDMHMETYTAYPPLFCFDSSRLWDWNLPPSEVYLCEDKGSGPGLNARQLSGC